LNPPKTPAPQTRESGAQHTAEHVKRFLLRYRTHACAASGLPNQTSDDIKVFLRNKWAKDKVVQTEGSPLLLLLLFPIPLLLPSRRQERKAGTFENCQRPGRTDGRTTPTLSRTCQALNSSAAKPVRGKQMWRKEARPNPQPSDWPRSFCCLFVFLAFMLN
jgi:hypothetical protein